MIGPRSTITEFESLRPGNGTSRSWTRTLNGVLHSFTAVRMPDGERRYFVKAYNGYCDDGTPEGRARGMRFDCAWTLKRQWIIKPTSVTPYLTTATPVEIDTEIARIEAEMSSKRYLRDAAEKVLDRAARDTYYATLPSYAQAKCSLALAEIALTRYALELTPYLVEYTRRGGWTRYFLVNSSNGHVHSDANPYRCSRTPSTEHGWLVSESGKTPQEVVELAGERACTVCFPWAPADTLSRSSAYTPPCEAEKVARRAERALRAALRNAKAITNPDGTPLRIDTEGYAEILGTIRAAELRAVDITFWATVYTRALTEKEENAIEQILAALAAKRGTTVEEERTEMQRKLRAKCKREQVIY